MKGVREERKKQRREKERKTGRVDERRQREEAKR